MRITYIVKLSLLVLVFSFSFAGIDGADGARAFHAAYAANESVIRTTEALPSGSIESDVAIGAAPAVVLIAMYQDAPVYTVKIKKDGRWLISHVRQIGTEKRRVSSGSGFFVTADGYIVTNKHVVPDANAEYRVRLDGVTEIPAQVVYRDAENDLAIVKIEGGQYPVISFAEGGAAVGESVIAVGNALGKYIDSVSSGSVSRLGRNLRVNEGTATEDFLKNLIQTDARLYPGDSGGPLLNAAGRLIGVNVAIQQGESISYSIPVDTVKSIIQKVGIAL